MIPVEVPSYLECLEETCMSSLRVESDMGSPRFVPAEVPSSLGGTPPASCIDMRRKEWEGPTLGIRGAVPLSCSMRFFSKKSHCAIVWKPRMETCQHGAEGDPCPHRQEEVGGGKELGNSQPRIEK